MRIRDNAYYRLIDSILKELQPRFEYIHVPAELVY